MRIHTRLLVLLLAMLALYGAALVALRRATQRIGNGVLETQLAEAAGHLDSTLALERAPIERSVFDNTFWDEMIAFVSDPDPEWAREYIDEAFPVFGIQQAWVFDPALRLVYAMPGPDAATRQPAVEALRRAVARDPFGRFYGRVGDMVVEYFCAPIQPSDDLQRRAEPRGWLVAARGLDAKYLAKLSAVSGAALTLVPDSGGTVPTNRIDDAASRVVLFAALRDAAGAPVALLRAQRDNLGLPVLRRALVEYNWLAVAFAGANLLLLGVFVVVWVRNPLQRISESLDRQEIAPVQRYLGARHEFGTIARLIQSFLGQRRALLGEIEMRRRSEQALREARDLADQSARAKSDFLSVMSHELRTPLNAVIGYADILLDERPRPDQVEYLRTLRFAGASLLALVNDVLDFNRIEAGKLTIERREFDPAGLIEMLLRTFRPQADAAGLTVGAALDPTLPLRVVGDPLRLAQVLSNLIGNAIKFTPAGSVTVAIAVLAADADSARLEFRVTDTGIGIAADKQKLIFEVFTQAESDTTRRYGGSGLGLSIAQRLVALMGGVITVESAPLHGATFSFALSFPLPGAPAARQLPLSIS
ncbi:MAG: ATP-binding protein [Deltaproteobacteria bacterium]|nr:ATP-binding protein [Deltaproteobacteria bacterium]